MEKGQDHDITPLGERLLCTIVRFLELQAEMEAIRKDPFVGPILTSLADGNDLNASAELAQYCLRRQRADIRLLC